MQCEQCREREAVVHLTQIVNEQVNTLHLCEKCAAERGVESPGLVQKTPLGSFLAAMGKGSGELPAAPVEGLACPGCGATLQDFREVGRLGCARCWEVFERPLRDLLRRLHGSVRHVGERYEPRGPVPSGEGAPAVPVPAPAPAAEALRAELRRAVEAENFELAAELRDRLRELE